MTEDVNKDSLYSISDVTLEILDDLLPVVIREKVIKAVKQERKNAVASTYQQTIAAVNHHAINYLTHSALKLESLLSKLKEVDGLEKEVLDLIISAHKDILTVGKILEIMSKTKYPTSTPYVDQIDMVYVDERMLKEITGTEDNLES